MEKLAVYEYTLKALKDALFDKAQDIVLRDKMTDEDVESLTLAIEAIADCKPAIEREKRWSAELEKIRQDIETKKKGSREE